MDVQLRWLDLRDSQLLMDHLTAAHAVLAASSSKAKDENAFNTVRRNHFLLHYEPQDHEH